MAHLHALAWGNLPHPLKRREADLRGWHGGVWCGDIELDHLGAVKGWGWTMARLAWKKIEEKRNEENTEHHEGIGLAGCDMR